MQIFLLIIGLQSRKNQTVFE